MSNPHEDHVDAVLRQRLLNLFKHRAFSFGDFTLASGKKSTYYVNSKKALFNADVAHMVGRTVYKMLEGKNVSAVGGLEMGAIPMAVATILYGHTRDQINPLFESFVVRKVAKDHGSKERVEGCSVKGRRVAILDDVLTTGSSAEEACKAVEELGAEVAAVICIVDRLDGARERLARYDFQSIFTINDFIEPPT